MPLSTTRSGLAQLPTSSLKSRWNFGEVFGGWSDWSRAWPNILGIFVSAMLSAGCTEPPSRSHEAPESNAGQVTDLAGRPVRPWESNAELVKVFIFSRTDCPIARRYAPAIQRLQEEYSPQGVHFQLVFPNPVRSAEEIREHLREFQYQCDALRDPEQYFVKLTGATVTPEAAVFDTTGQMVYCGRIDDRFPKFGVSREPSSHDLENAIQATLAGQPAKPADGPAVGCYIADLL